MRHTHIYLLGVALFACIAMPAFGADKFLTLNGRHGQGTDGQGTDGLGKGKKIVLISGDEEYRSEEVMPMLAKILSQHHGFDCVVLFSWSKDGTHIDPNNGASLEGLEQLDDADLMICATRFRTPPAAAMQSFDKFLDAGKPVIGMRTATHGFKGKWSFFGMQILGEQWDGHHGGHKQQGCRGVIEEANAQHAILNGVKDVFAASDVYGVSHLKEESTLLLRSDGDRKSGPHVPTDCRQKKRADATAGLDPPLRFTWRRQGPRLLHHDGRGGGLRWPGLAAADRQRGTLSHRSRGPLGSQGGIRRPFLPELLRLHQRRRVLAAARHAGRRLRTWQSASSRSTPPARPTGRFGSWDPAGK